MHSSEFENELYEDDLEIDYGPSKTRLKKESHALQDLGQVLMDLSKDQLSRLDLPENLREAVLIGQGITAHGGLKRQRKYIGKILRDLDAAPIRAAIADLKGEGLAAVRLQHQCEQWRQQLLEQGDHAVNEFISQYPGAERQKLRQFIRDAIRDREAGKPPRAYRMMFKYLKEVLGDVPPEL